MNDLLAKISSYDLFNCLLPGIVFVVLADQVTEYSISIDNVLASAFLYYFIGLVISRFGATVLYPVLKKMKFLAFSDYKAYCEAEAKDPKIKVLSEINNTYRSMSATAVLLVVVKLYNVAEIKWGLPEVLRLALLVGVVLFLFLFSWKTQTDYIRKRVDRLVD